MKWWEALQAWGQTGIVLAGGFFVHLLISRVFLRGLKRVAAV